MADSFREARSNHREPARDPFKPDNGPNCSPDSRRSQAHSINETALLRMKIFAARHQTLVLKSSAAVQGERSRSHTVRQFNLPAITGCSSAASCIETPYELDRCVRVIHGGARCPP